jgi:hypothetical protein
VQLPGINGDQVRCRIEKFGFHAGIAR